MYYLLFILLAITLMATFYFDLKYYAIPVYLLIAALLLVSIRIILHGDAPFVLRTTGINLLGTTIFLLIAVLYIFLRKGKLFNPLDRIIGTGDLVFFPVVCGLFSPMNYLFFIISSFVIILILKMIVLPGKRHIPLAGAMSFFLLLVLIASELTHLDLYNDNLLLSLIFPYAG